MPDERSISIAPDHFERLADLAARQLNADLFLTNSCDPRRRNVIGLAPQRELIVTARTSRADLEAFAFDDSAPACGFLTYQYGLLLRGLHDGTVNRFPLGHLKKYAVTLSYDSHAHRLDIEEHYPDHGLDLGHMIQAAARHEIRLDPEGDPGNVCMSLNRDEYIERVERIIEYIRGGYTYQLNLTSAFGLAWPGLDDIALFFQLWRNHPASHYSRFSSGPYRLLSTSPELFLRAHEGRVISEPIKGTLQIDGSLPEAVARLTSSAKEDAELSMIVDLIRNDISYHCEYGSVRVEDHKATFVVDDLLQMYSRVGGRIRAGASCLDLMLDAFPCGSVTGCPKRKTMQLIAELEPHARDIYCGSMFVIRDRLTMESSVAIRSGYYDTESAIFRFFAGSGIVVRSDPEAEYRETIAKAGKFLRLIEAKRSSRAAEVRVDQDAAAG